MNDDKQIFEDYYSVVNFMETLDQQIADLAKMVKEGVGWIDPDYAMENIFTLYMDEYPNPSWDALKYGGSVSWHGIKISINLEELTAYVTKKLEEFGVTVKEDDGSEDY